ncbi:FixH family protein [Guyparkeria halophila]|uniref:FixH family protein n=1 Tax=Guyparkeria halophila TaxID=47960 RepID=A0ABZ0Z0H3_9GAMM|nr:FixH family protein [Guyparkeria halophila]WQH16880.1 FixH family protein [Guyparkeria halophila]
MAVLLPAALGMTIIPMLFFLLRWRFPSAGRQIAFILGVLSLAAYAPYAIINWPGLDVVAMVGAILVMTAFILGFISPPKHAESQKMAFHRGPATIIAFFAVIILLDSIFLTIATTGLSENVARQILPEPQGGPVATSFFPGTVAHDYQEKVRAFEAYDAAREEQSERGWQVQRGWMGEAVVGQSTPFRIQVRDGQGNPVEGAEATARFLRFSSQSLDFSRRLEEIDPGVYQADVTPSRPGRWEVIVDVRRDGETHQLRGMTDVAAR